MAKAGIWIDSKKAWIMKISNSEEVFEQIISDVDDSRVGGGSGTSIPHQSQSANPEDRLLNKRNEQFKEFFDKVMATVKDSESILIEGPAEAKLGLVKKIKGNKTMKEVPVEMRNADSLTENQFRADMRNYYSED